MLITLGKKPLLPRSVWSDKALKLPCPHLSLSTIQLIMSNMNTRTCSSTDSLSFFLCASLFLSFTRINTHKKIIRHFKGPFLHTIIVDKLERRASLVYRSVAMNYQPKSMVSMGFKVYKLCVKHSYICELANFIL